MKDQSAGAKPCAGTWAFNRLRVNRPAPPPTDQPLQGVDDLNGLLMSDQRIRSGRTGKAHAFFRPAWKFPVGIQAQVEAVLSGCPGPVLNVCSGARRLGDVKIDLVHPRADIHADARHLPFASSSFGTVFMDPPYRLPGNDLVERQHFINEAGRVIRPGGVLLLHAPWMPAPLWADLEDVWVRHQVRHRLPGPAVLLTKWRAKATKGDGSDGQR